MLNLINKSILIYGFGLSGKSCFKHLKNYNNVKVYDDNEKVISSNFNKYKINRKILKKFKFDFVVISPGINKTKCKLKNFLSNNKKIIINELDVFYYLHKSNLKITITGTNGKSTTTKLIYEILKNSNFDVRIGGNIGYSLLNQKNVKKNTIFIIEASSYQIDYAKYFITDIAVILNISPDHIERHKTYANYVKTKFKLIFNQNKNGTAFINNNNFFSSEIKKYKIKSKIIRVKNLPEVIKKNISNEYFNNLNNKENLKFALRISKYFNVNIKKFIQSVNSFKGLPYRNEIIYNSRQLLIINDSKSTTFSSTINILKSYSNIYWILGGKYKIGDKFKIDKKYLKNIRGYIFGEKYKYFVKILNKKIIFKKRRKLNDLLNLIINDATKDNNKKCILFSPSAASFDQFENFVQRGIAFNNLIKKTEFIKKIGNVK